MFPKKVVIWSHPLSYSTLRDPQIYHDNRIILSTTSNLQSQNYNHNHVTNEPSQCKMEAREHSHFALPNSSPSFSDLLIMCKIIGLLPSRSLGSGNCVVTCSSRKWLSESGHLSSCTSPVTAALSSGVPLSLCHPRRGTAGLAWHTQRDSALHQGQQSHVQYNNLAWPQLICFSPSIHKTQKQWVWLSPHGNPGLTQVLSLFSTIKIKHVFCNSDYYLLYATNPWSYCHLNFLTVWGLQICIVSFSAHWPTCYQKDRH